jgi:plastocyanin
MRRAIPVLALTTALLLVPAAAGTGASKVKKVKIADNFYSPAKLTVHPGTTIKWVWPSDVGDTHDVNLGKRPKHVKVFYSDLVATGYSYKKTLKKPGKYFIYCSLHDDMKMTITVKKH